MVSDDLYDRLDGLDDHFGVGTTDIVVVVPTRSTTGDDANPDEWPSGVRREDIIIEHRQSAVGPDGEDVTWTEPVVPIYRPPEYRGGVVCMSERDIARVFDTMPDDIREREREYRCEHGDPIPPILQQ